jgi:hypothetical protein
MKDFIDKTPDKSGTPLNRANLMAMQGFIAKTIIFNDNSVVETNALGETKTTVFNSDNSITETFEGKKTITKTTYFGDDGTITEEVIG